MIDYIDIFGISDKMYSNIPDAEQSEMERK